MPNTEYFPQRPNKHPMIYAYEDKIPEHKGLLKVGYTSIDVDKRVAQQFPIKSPDGKLPYRIVVRESAMYPDGSNFKDHDVHKVLERMRGVIRKDGEWFKCTVKDVLSAILKALSNKTGSKIEKSTCCFYSYYIFNLNRLCLRGCDRSWFRPEPRDCII